MFTESPAFEEAGYSGLCMKQNRRRSKVETRTGGGSESTLLWRTYLEKLAMAADSVGYTSNTVTSLVTSRIS